MDSAAVEAAKRALRHEARALGGDRSAEAARCLDKLLALPGLRGSGTVALYASVGDEVPVERCAAPLRSRGWRVLFPRIRVRELELCEAQLDELVAASSRPSLREPPRERLPVEIGDVDVFLIPGLLFARDGTRLGRGSGHYDRLLGRARPGAPRIGICYADRVRDALPSAPHDVPVDLIVTDRDVLDCPAMAGSGRSR